MTNRQITENLIALVAGETSFLGVRKTYPTYDDMTNDTNPTDDEGGEYLQFGQLVAVTEDEDTPKNGLYRFNNPGWVFVGRLGDLSIYLKKNSGLVYKGIAYPDTVPAEEDYSVFYHASQNGFYKNFDNYDLRGNKVVMFENSTGVFVPYVLFEGEAVKDVQFGGAIDPAYDLLSVTEPTWFFVSPGNYYTHDGVIVATDDTSILTFNGFTWAIQPFCSNMQFTNEFFDTI